MVGLRSLRKLVHVAGVLFVPIALYDQYIALALAVLVTLVFIVFERQKRRMMPRFFRLIYRDHELSTVAYEPLAYLLSIVVLLALSLAFSPAACYVAIVVMTVGDGVAAMAGPRLRGPRWPGSMKTLAGSFAGIVVAAAIGCLIAAPAMAIAGALGGMVTEAFAGRYDNALTAAAALVCAAAALMFLHL